MTNTNVTLNSILLSACGSEDKDEKNQSPYAQLNADIDIAAHLDALKQVPSSTRAGLCGVPYSHRY